MTISYTEELEALIVDQLLPTYVKYWQAKGIRYPLDSINNKIMSKYLETKKQPLLFLAKEKWPCNINKNTV